MTSEIVALGSRKRPLAPRGWLVKVTNPHKEMWFGVGIYSQRLAETAVCRLTQIEPTDVVFAHRRLLPTEIESLSLERGKLSLCSFVEDTLLPDELGQKKPSSTEIFASAAKQQLPNDGIFEQGQLRADLEVPTELRKLVVRSVDHAEKAFCFFFDAARESLLTIPQPAMTLSESALSFIERNIKAAFDHARKIVQATDPQEAMRIQSEFLKSQFTTVDEHVRKIAGEIAPDKDVLAR
jgi:phasin